MRKFTHENITEALGKGFEFYGVPPTGAMELRVDTRETEPGDLFVGLRGGDTPEIAAKAAEKGAAACILSCGGTSLPCYRVVDTVKALQDLSAYQRARIQIPMIAVTGSCGKTTTKNMLGSILSQLGGTLVTQGNLNNEIGLPLTLLRLGDEYSYAVVEMGMNHKGEIQALSRLARPEAAVITNVGSAHIEFLGSRENIAEAKAEVFRGLPPCGRAALPRDCDFYEKLRDMAKRLGLEVVPFGPGGDFEFILKEEKGEGLFGELRTPMGSVELRVPVIGYYNAFNVAAAAAGAFALIPDIKLETLRAGLENFKGEKLRNEIRQGLGATFILDCYNANPDSMRASLSMLRKMPTAGRKIALLGDMLEIGEKTEEAHRELGRFAGEFLDALFTVGENAETYLKGAREAGTACRLEACQPSETAEKLAAYVKKDDLVLFKGSRANKLENYFFLLEK